MNARVVVEASYFFHCVKPTQPNGGDIVLRGGNIFAKNDRDGRASGDAFEPRDVYDYELDADADVPLAWAVHCEVDQFGRPTAGQVHFHSQYFGLSIETLRSTALHEIVHALAFSSDLLPTFRNGLGDAWASTTVNEAEPPGRRRAMGPLDRSHCCGRPTPRSSAAVQPRRCSSSAHAMRLAIVWAAGSSRFR